MTGLKVGKVTVEKLTDEQLKKLNINSWGTWECEVSKFDWQYSDEEMCYFYEGEVVVETPDGNVEINAGDFVTFPKGLKCVWNVKKPVRKSYIFN